MSSRPWVPFVAAGLALLIFGGALGATPAAVPALVVGGFAFLVAIVVAFRGRRDKYDLGVLRDIHEEEIVRSIELAESDEIDSVLCVYCGTAYTSDLPVCPTCGQR